MTRENKSGQGRGIRFLRDHVAYDGDECLIWPMLRDDKGYGIVGLHGRARKAARVMCELAYGPPPHPNYESAHSCGKGHEGCVNPRHLSWMTRSENQRERRKHGTHGTRMVGRRSKLTPAQVREIRQLAGTMTQRAIATRFNCHPTHISKLLSGARWKKTPSWLRHLDRTGHIR